MDDGWKDGWRDYGDGWIGQHVRGANWFHLAGPSDDRATIDATLDGTPDDCDLLHACLVALRERPDVLRAALGVVGDAAEVEP